MFFLLSFNNNNYMTYCWPNSAFFNFQSLLIKGIADNILAFFFWQTGTNGCTCKKANVSIYISLHMNNLLKTGVCMIKVIYLHVLSGWWYSRVCAFLICQSNMNDDIIPLVTIFIMINVKVWKKKTHWTNNRYNNDSLNVSKNVHVKGTEKKKWLRPEKETPITASGLV